MKIIVNFDEIETEADELSYEDIVRLSGSTRKALHTIVCKVKGLEGRCVTPGETVKVVEGMYFHAVVTDNA